MPRITVNGTSLHYLTRGRADAPAVVLVHGFPLDGRMWDAQAEALAEKGWRVIVPDLRGFGESVSEEPFTIESLADDLHALLDSLNALRAVLGGLSMGGYVSLAYVRKYPTTLRGLMLVDTRAEADTAQGRENRATMIELARTQGAKAIAEAMREKLVAPYTISLRPDIAGRVQRIMEACPALTIEHALAAMRDRTDQTDLLPSITVPTLVVVGDRDAMTPPAVATAMHQAIPRSELSVIRGAGHMSPMEQAGQVNAAMGRFLEGLAV
jgi:pimeloyl-ACP methyl ester carboxylesterase